jgi:hypothetical protein
MACLSLKTIVGIQEPVASTDCVVTRSTSRAESAVGGRLWPIRVLEAAGLGLLLFLLSGAVALGNTIHVPADQPTIQAAIDAAADGDTILVAPGTYQESIDFKAKTLTLQSMGGPAVTIIEGQGLNPTVSFGSAQGPESLLTGFTIQHGAGSTGAGIVVNQGSPRIVGNVIANNGQGSSSFGSGISGGSSSPDIEQNIFQNNSCDSQFLSGVVSFINVSSPTIASNVFVNNPCRAIDMTLPAGSFPQVINNTIIGNSGGIRVDARIPTSQQIYENNILVNNTIGLEVDFGSTANNPTWKNNDVFGNATEYSGIADLTGTSGNISMDPLFVNFASSDFHLQAGSPAIDAGDNAAPGIPITDFDGNDRILDGKGNCNPIVDMGAFEFGHASKLTFSLISFVFPDQPVGVASNAKAVTVTNTGSTAATVCKVTATSDFAQTTNSCGNSLSAGANCVINLVFTPTARGNRTGFVQVITNDAGSPQSIILSGKGIAPVVSLSATFLGFGSSLVGVKSASQIVTVSNTGDDALTIFSLTISGDFAQTNTCGSSVAVSQSCSIVVTFTPTATGARSGSITINDNAMGTPHTVPLSGNGIDFSLGAAAGSSTTATIVAGQTAIFDLQVAPTGFTGIVNLTFSDTPPASTFTISPTSVNLNSGTAQAFSVGVATMSRSIVFPRLQLPKPIGKIPFSIPTVLWLLTALLLILARRAAPKSGRGRLAIPAAAMILFGILLVGCNGGSTTTMHGTPANTYTLTVTGTDEASGATRTVSLTLNVK